MNSGSSAGKIVTFYSYKGGTGRSMALANVAFILASSGKRVLMLDWDVEAPGLHRYFAPLLKDPDVVRSPGLMNFFVEFVLAAKRSSGGPANWYEDYTNLLGYARAIQWEFEGAGALHFVPAGRQDAAYGTIVNSFDWREFYEELGGGVFLEAVKRELREYYDYILIDSRTGLSDTSGICSVQMPDELVVCFTLNNQSILGAQAAASSAYDARIRPDGLAGMKVWPVPMRVEAVEFTKVTAAMSYAKERFSRFTRHLTRSDASQYWSDVQVPYRPFFAFEEVLAVFADPRNPTLTLLAPMLNLCRWLTAGEVSTLPPIREDLRVSTLERFLRRPGPPSRIFVTYDRFICMESARLIGALVERLGESRVGAPRDMLATFEFLGIPASQYPFAAPAWDSDLSGLYGADAMIAIVGPKWGLNDPVLDPSMLREIRVALIRRRPVVVVKLGDWGHPRIRRLPDDLQRAFQDEILGASNDFTDEQVDAIVNAVERAVAQFIEAKARIVDADDPQKGQWGGLAKRDGRELMASVTTRAAGIFDVTLAVRQLDPGRPLEGTVKFYLHPTFRPDVVEVTVTHGKADLALLAYGAFTVGAAADGGFTMLELNLALNPRFPEKFRAH